MNRRLSFIFVSLVILCVGFAISDGVLKKEYIVGDIIKLDLNDFEEYVVKIVSPDGSYVQKSDERFFIFEVSVVGNYIIDVASSDKRKVFEFVVTENKGNVYVDLDDVDYSKLDTLLTIHPIDETELKGSRIIVGKDVKWEKQEYVSGEKDLIIQIPKSATDVNVDGFGNINYQVKDSLTNSVLNLVRGQKEKSVVIKNARGDLKIKYITPGPEKSEEFISRDRKKVTVFSEEEFGYTDVLAYTDIEERIPVGKKGMIKVYWKNENKNVDFEAFDKNGNGLIDYIEWNVPHLSEQIFEIILISAAEHLDEDRIFMENVYDYVKEVDDIWVLIEDKEYLRVSFEKNLTSVNDITIFARSLNNDSARVEVYVLQGDDSGEPKNSYVKIAEFENVGEEGWYKIYLTGLFGSQDSFDLRVIGNVEFDYVVDPTTGGTVSAGLRPQNVTCYADGIEVSCGGTYPGSCPAGGGGDHLSCDDASAESHSTRKNDSARVQAIYYNSSINDCVNVTHVELCYEWSTSASLDACFINYDNDEDSTWTGLTSVCPATTYSDCVDVSSEESGWACEDFFGAIGTRAQINSQQTRVASSPGSASWDQLWFNVTYIQAGTLNASLNEPSTSEINNQTIYEVFVVNTTIKCWGNTGDSCGVVNGSIQYNSTGAEPDIQISTTPGAQPFFADLGEQTCGELKAITGQDSCELIWQINATQLGTWEIDVLSSSQYSNVYDNHTLNAEIAVFNSPSLELNLTFPESDPEINDAENFELNCSVECSGQGCLDVEVFPIFCEGVSCSPNLHLNTTSSGLSADSNGVNFGDLGAEDSEIASFDITGLYGDYVISCNATSSNTENITSVRNLSIHVNDFPVADFAYPSESEWLSGIEILDGSDSSDADGTVDNYKFEIDDNVDFSSPSEICDGVSATCNLNTSLQMECGQETSDCYLRLNVTDDDGATNATVIQIGIDNVGATATVGVPLNDSYISSESQIVNASASDSGSGMDCVEFSFYNGSWNLLNVDCLTPYEYNWDLSLVPDQVLEVRARANDSEGNFGDYDIHGNITHDTTAPFVVLDSPENDSYLNSSSQNFSFSVKDTMSEILSCFLIVDGNDDVNKINSSVINNTLTIFSVDSIVNAEHNWSVNCTDNSGNENFSATKVFTIDTISPEIYLESPLDDSESDENSITFNYIGDDDNLDSCELWGNWSSGWHLNQTNLSVVDGETGSFNVDIDDGNYIWNVWCNDSAGNYGWNSSNYSFSVLPDIFGNGSDIFVNDSDILFSNPDPVEGENISINVTVYNLAETLTGNFVVGLYDGDPEGVGQSLENHTISLSGYSDMVVNFTWIAEIGKTNFFIVADFNESVNESNESNNVANSSFDVGSWQKFYGNASIEILLSGLDSGQISAWGNETVLNGNIFITDQESSIEWLSLIAIGINDSGYNSSNDFYEIDSFLGTTDFEDSISTVFSDEQVPINTSTFYVHGEYIENVPITNSTNDFNFITGILWDDSKDSNGEYDSEDKEDLVFISKMNQEKQGEYGIYDYEINIPVRLRSYDDSDESQIYLYYDLN